MRHPTVSAALPGKSRVGLLPMEFYNVNAKNFYIVATAPNEPSLQVKISGPYLTRQAAQADLAAAINEAMEIDPSAKNYNYSISKVESRKPGVIQHMAAHA